MVISKFMKLLMKLLLHMTQCEENQPDILNHSIQLNEVESVIADLSNNKSPGLDGITNAFIKHAPNRSIHVAAICSLYNLILHTAHIPKQWCHAIITPMHKKVQNLK